MPQARDPKRRWYGVYANYNTPAYNTNHVKESELPKTWEEFAEKKSAPVPAPVGAPGLASGFTFVPRYAR